ncbi:oncoprotein-induced transcript 3 protein-like [Strongylocentrotus purpuratus]|uniref:Zona pellucida sperm-binding protein 3 n=1 Tax=Strongylocentrotus purpuratus TaxID=7668 RepID=A0A7M7NDM1_STRPU|nr:oncoprotein-induced transcript 3 protein-like [Strongylocentrotus purpuratus]
MTVNIDERLVSGEASAVHFKDRSCSGVKNDSTNEITLTTEYNQCGTIIEEDNTTITFVNVITYAKPGSDDDIVITREYHMQVKVACCLEKEEIVSGSFRPQLGEVSFSDKGSGDFSLSLQRFLTNAFVELNSDATTVLQGDDLYFAVTLESVASVGMFIDRCWATTTQDMDSAGQHSLIAQGCPDEYTVEFYPLPGLNEERFSFEAFAFVGDYTEVYIHCSVKVCGAEEAQLLRDAECPADIEPPPPARKRRSSSVMSTQTIRNGPIRIRRSTSDMATNVTTDLASFNPFAMLLLGMIATLVAMAILMGVVKLARFKPDIRYQQVPIESMEGI